jgi:hypothetical protein
MSFGLLAGAAKLAGPCKLLKTLLLGVQRERGTSFTMNLVPREAGGRLRHGEHAVKRDQRVAGGFGVDGDLVDHPTLRQVLQ